MWVGCGVLVNRRLLYISAITTVVAIEGEKCVLKKSLVDIIIQFIAYRYFIFPPKKVFFFIPSDCVIE